MITYYGTQISPRQIETGEGFLICKSVPIARVGDQEYLSEEVGLPSGKVVIVHRPEAEVFDAAAMASFEGKPFTNNHPPVMLTPETAGSYEVGHVQNVRRGVGEWDGYLVADIHVHDAATISDIQNGKREISCGYECVFEQGEDGTMTQRKIRGNHVALVTEGRAGDRAAIMDANRHTPTQQAAGEPSERTEPMSKKKTLWSLFGMAAHGQSAEEITRLAMDTAEAVKEAGDEEAPAEPEAAPAPAQDDTDYQKKLFEAIDGLKTSFDSLVATLTPAAPAEEKPEEPEDGDPVEEALQTIEAEIRGDNDDEEDPAAEPAADEDAPAEPAAEAPAAEDTEEAHVIPAEELDEDAPAAEDRSTMDALTAKLIITSMRESIAGITDEKQRKAVTDAMLGLIKRPAKVSDAAKIAEAGKTIASRSKEMDIDAVQAAYDALNPHKKKN